MSSSIPARYYKRQHNRAVSFIQDEEEPDYIGRLIREGEEFIRNWKEVMT
jgi:hypothetical protein